MAGRPHRRTYRERGGVADGLPFAETLRHGGSDDMAEPTPEVLQDLHRTDGPHPAVRGGGGRLSEAGRLPGFLHLYVGQEAVAAGVCANLTDDDQITSTHRGHGHLSPRAATSRAMSPSCRAGVTGYCRGRGGTMHINDLDLRHARRQRHRRRRACRSPSAPAFADRYRATAASPSTVLRRRRHQHRRLPRGAPTWPPPRSLPVVFVCENNGYAEFTPQSSAQADHRRRRPGRRLRHARRDRRRHGRGRRPRGAPRGRRAGPARRRPDR